MKAKNVVTWFEIYVNGMDRAQKFYEAVFDLKMELMPAPEENGIMVAFPWADDAPNAAGALVKDSMNTPGKSGTIIDPHHSFSE